MAMGNAERQRRYRERERRERERRRLAALLAEAEARTACDGQLLAYDPEDPEALLPYPRAVYWRGRADALREALDPPRASERAPRR